MAELTGSDRTHNGLVHVLDAVMMPLEQLNATNAASGTPSVQPSPTATNTASSTAATSTAAAPVTKMLRSTSGLWAFGVSLFALL